MNTDHAPNAGDLPQTNPSQTPTNNPFDLSETEMKKMGYRVVDMIVEHFQSLETKRPVTQATREAMDWLLQEPIPEYPTPIHDVLDHVESNIFTNSAHLDHPKFYSFVPSPNNIVSTFADALATGFNLFSGAWFLPPEPPNWRCLRRIGCSACLGSQ